MKRASFAFDIGIAASPETVYRLVADLHGYETWLGRSESFRGTRLAEGPVEVGTTYVEPGPFGVRHGRVVEVDPPRRIVFEQPMTLRPAMAGHIEITLAVVVTPTDDGVRVRRLLELGFAGPAAFMVPVVKPLFGRENRRVLVKLKAAAESA